MRIPRSFILTIVLNCFGAFYAELTAQSMSINSSGDLPDQSAMLDISSVSKGLLIPRLTEAQRTSITTPATSLVVYQTNNNVGFYYFNNQNTWEYLVDSTILDSVLNTVGDTLGNHQMTQNLVTNGFYLSGDGDSEGLIIDSLGRVFIDTNDAVIDETFTVHSKELSWGIVNTDGDVAIGTWLYTGFAGQFGTFSNHRIDFITNNSAPQITIDTTGYLGIGNVLPSRPLDVTGSATVDQLNINDQYTFPTNDGALNQILATDGTGNVTWQSLSGTNDADWTIGSGEIYNLADNVGIGGAPGTYKLYVLDTIQNVGGIREPMRFESHGTADSASDNRVLSAYNQGTNGFNIGMFGVSWGASSGENRGMTGIASNSSNWNIGLVGGATSTVSGVNYGVFGSASNSSDINRGIVGYISNTVDSSDAAVYGIANGEGMNIGLWGRAHNNNGSGQNIGLYTKAINGLENYAAYFERGLVYSGDSVGIGLKAPSQKLTVYSQQSDHILLTSEPTAAGVSNHVNSGAISFMENNDKFDNFGYGFQFAYDGASNKMRLRANNGGVLDTTMTIVRANGYLGLGTDNPNYTFHLKNSIAGIRLEDEDDNTSLFISSPDPTGGGTGGIGTADSIGFPLYAFNQDLVWIGANQRVGIGTSNPVQKLDVRGSGIDDGGLIMLGNSDLSHYMQFFSGRQFDPEPFIQVKAGDPIRFATDAGGWTELMRIDTSGYVGIGTTNINKPLTVNGEIKGTGFTCYSPGTNSHGNRFNLYWTGLAMQMWVDNTNIGTIFITSDRRLKENISNMNGEAIARVQQLKPVSFQYKNIDNSIFNQNSTIVEGFIADELQEIIPSAVNGSKDALTSDGNIQPQTINVIPLVSVLTKAVQEQQELIEKQAAQIAELERKVSENQTNTDLTEELEKLKSMILLLTEKSEYNTEILTSEIQP